MLDFGISMVIVLAVWAALDTIRLDYSDGWTRCGPVRFRTARVPRMSGVMSRENLIRVAAFSREGVSRLSVRSREQLSRMATVSREGALRMSSTQTAEAARRVARLARTEAVEALRRAGRYLRAPRD